MGVCCAAGVYNVDHHVVDDNHIHVIQHVFVLHQQHVDDLVQFVCHQYTVVVDNHHVDFRHLEFTKCGRKLVDLHNDEHQHRYHNLHCD